MKKGQEVRILRNNQIATIVDIELIKKGGKVHQYCRLKTDKQPDLWMDASQLGDIIERCKVTFAGDNGQEIYFAIEQNHAKGDELKVTISGNQGDLRVHTGLSSLLGALFAEMLSKSQVD